jgi:hypothetical protein
MALATPGEAFEPLPLRRKVALAYEIVRTYVRVRRAAKDRDIRAVIDEIRADAPSREQDRAALVNGLRLGRAVGRTLRFLPTDTRCLIRSLVLTEMLSRRGIQASVVIGVRSDDGFEAHAWVEHRGAPLLPDEDFGRLVEFPAGPSPEHPA